jgi:hypothetical protein
MLANGVLHVMTVLGLTQRYQYLFQGALSVALVYSTVRRQAAA